MYKHIKNDIDRFDTSDYPSENIYNIPLVNKKVLGKMKDECSERILSEFVGLKSKMYALKLFYSHAEKEKLTTEQKNKLQDLGVTKKAKGITNTSLKTITFDDYYNCLFNKTEIHTNEQLIRSKKHEVYTINQKKLPLHHMMIKELLIIYLQIRYHRDITNGFIHLLLSLLFLITFQF